MPGPSPGLMALSARNSATCSSGDSSVAGIAGSGCRMTASSSATSAGSSGTVGLPKVIGPNSLTTVVNYQEIACGRGELGRDLELRRRLDLESGFCDEQRFRPLADHLEVCLWDCFPLPDDLGGDLTDPPEGDGVGPLEPED